MIDYSKYLPDGRNSLEKELSHKEDSVILSMRRNDGAPFILRIYRQEIPAYSGIAENRCENLPRIYHCESRDGLFFVEEEYIDGISVAQMIDGGTRMDEKRASEITSSICTAVSHLHEKGYIHRDIKPEHVLLTEEGRVVLIDLDASMKVIPEKPNDTQLLGTAGYAAPEQFGLTRSDQRADIYAIGILLNELLTGVHPAVKLYHDGPLKQVIEKSTRINPEDRYQSSAQLRKALMDISENTASPFPKKAKTALIACAALIIITISGFAFWGPDNSPDTIIDKIADSHTDVTEDNGNGDEVSPADGTADSQTAEASSKDNGKGSSPSKTPAKVAGTDYLQLYKDGRSTEYLNPRPGRQSAPLYTEDGKRIDESYYVYADESIGFVEWAPEYNSWGIISDGCAPGSTGLIHAEKNGKHYAIRVQVYPEPACIYTQVPDIGNIARGYVNPQYYDNNLQEGLFSRNYKKNKKVTLYLVASCGFNLDNISCDSDLVSIKTYTGARNYPYPIKVLTFYNPDGGDVQFRINSQYNSMTFNMTEK